MRYPTYKGYQYITDADGDGVTILGNWGGHRFNSLTDAFAAIDRWCSYTTIDL